MGTKRAAVAAAAVAAGGAGLRIAAARRRAGWPTRPPRRPPEPHWHAVTVNVPAERLSPGGRPPAELADLGDLIEVRVRDAPGGRGTELAARLRDGERYGLGSATGRLRGTDPVQRVRAALRRAKQEAETGEVLRGSGALGASLRALSGGAQAEPGFGGAEHPPRSPADLLDRHGLSEGRI